METTPHQTVMQMVRSTLAKLSPTACVRQAQREAKEALDMTGTNMLTQTDLALQQSKQRQQRRERREDAFLAQALTGIAPHGT